MGPGAFPPPFGFGGMYLYHCEGEEEGGGLVPYLFFDFFFVCLKKYKISFSRHKPPKKHLNLPLSDELLIFVGSIR